jgi:hypothetical protein
VDICSGVRTNGELDFEKLSNFFKEIESVNFSFLAKKAKRSLEIQNVLLIVQQILDY